MSIETLRQLLTEKLGDTDMRRFNDGHLQSLLDKEYSNEGALRDATREGLEAPPGLPPTLVHILLKAFGQAG